MVAIDKTVGPVQNENARPLVKQSIRLSRWSQQSMKPSMGPFLELDLCDCPGYMPRKLALSIESITIIVVILWERWPAPKDGLSPPSPWGVKSWPRAPQVTLPSWTQLSLLHLLRWRGWERTRNWRKYAMDLVRSPALKCSSQQNVIYTWLVNVALMESAKFCKCVLNGLLNEFPECTYT